jgi:hypothetical protein
VNVDAGAFEAITGQLAERPGISHGVSDLREQISDGLAEHKSTWELLISTAREVRRHSSRCEQLDEMLRQRNIAYDTLIKAGEESARRRLGFGGDRATGTPRSRPRHLPSVRGKR